MPAELERRLKKQAQKKDIQNPGAYVYGTLRKTGWKPSKENSKHETKTSTSSSGKKTITNRANRISKEALQRRMGNSGNLGTKTIKGSYKKG